MKSSDCVSISIGWSCCSLISSHSLLPLVRRDHRVGFRFGMSFSDALFLGVNYRLHCTDRADSAEWVFWLNTHHLHNRKVQLLWWMCLSRNCVVGATKTHGPTLNWTCPIEFCQLFVISIKSAHCDSYLYIAFVNQAAVQLWLCADNRWSNSCIVVIVRAHVYTPSVAE